MHRQLSWHLLASLALPFGSAMGVMMTAGWVGIVTLEVLRAPIALGWRALFPLALGLLPQLWVWLLPIAVAVALVSSLQRWRTEGTWEGLQSLGIGGTALLPAVSFLVVVVGLATSCLTHWAAPAGQEWVADLLAEEARPRSGELVQLGDWKVVAERVSGDRLEGVLAVTSEAACAAPEGRLNRDSGHLELVDGEMVWWGELPVRMTWKKAQWRMDSAASAPARHPSYQRSIFLKRTSWPIAVGLILLWAVPATLSGRNWLPLCVFLLFWAMTRTMDHMAGSTGAFMAAWLPTFVLAVGTIRSWLTWSER